MMMNSSSQQYYPRTRECTRIRHLHLCIQALHDVTKPDTEICFSPEMLYLMPTLHRLVCYGQFFIRNSLLFLRSEVRGTSIYCSMAYYKLIQNPTTLLSTVTISLSCQYFNSSCKFLASILGISKKHVSIVFKEHWIFHSSITGCKTTLHYNHLF